MNAVNLIISLIFDPYLEGPSSAVAVIKGDRGGVTQGGVSSRSYPEYADQLARGVVSEETLRDIYFRDYYSKIVGWEDLTSKFPRLMALLFFGAVHGIGDNDYTSVIQSWLNSVKKASLKVDGIWGKRTFHHVNQLAEGERQQLWEHLLLNRDALAIKRAIAVGIPEIDAAIRRRVRSEFAIAAELRGGTDSGLILSQGKVVPVYTTDALYLNGNLAESQYVVGKGKVTRLAEFSIVDGLKVLA